MKFLILSITFLIGCYAIETSAQQIGRPDTLYVQSYEQKIKLMGFLSTSFIQVDNGDKLYTPNYPLTAGVGFAVRNTIFGAQAGYGFFPLKDRASYGKSKMVDLQVHKYSQKMIYDLFFQNYKGFYSERDVGKVDGLLPEMSVMQIGGEASYLFNGDRYSSKAAFDLSEIQLRSAGSFLLGGGTYYYRIKGLKKNSDAQNNFENIQLGFNAGYAYSYVINERWMISAMAKAGANFGNVPAELKKGKAQVLPTAFARFASNYHKKEWGISMIIIIGNKSLYPLKSDVLSLTDVSMQLSYVKHLNHFFGSKQ